MNMQHKLLLSTVCIFTLSACGGSGSGSSNPQPTSTVTTAPTSMPTNMPTSMPTDMPTMAPAGVTLDDLQSTVFGPSCGFSGCHSGSSAPFGLSLDSADNSFQNLVGVASGQQSNLMRVMAGNAENSYLIHKLEGRPSISGLQMPRNGTPLSTALIQNVKDWINNGAPRTGAGTTASKPSFSAANITQDLASVQLHFSKPVDTDTVSTESVQVYFNIQGEQVLASSDQYELTVTAQNIDIEIMLTDIAADSIVVHVNSPELSAILDSDGRLIDGDLDNVDGGVAVYVFDI